MAFGETPKAIIQSGLAEALDTMEGMCGNAGQTTVFNDHVEPAFRENAQADVESGWEDVNIGEYMDFMGEIVAEGNSIMEAAYEYAQEVQAAIDMLLT